MKNLSPLILVVLIVMNACNNSSKPSDKAPNTAASSKMANIPSSAADSIPSDRGWQTYAEVFIDGTHTGLSGANIQAIHDGKVVSTLVTPANGVYAAISGFESGQTYSFVATKAGYKNDTATSVYNGTPQSLPNMGMKDTAN